jgi:hypothetical protein
MSEPSNEEVILAIRELMRQWQRMSESVGTEPIEDYLRSSGAREVFKRITELLKGEITIGEFEAATDHLHENTAAMARDVDDPAQVTMVDAENEAAAKNLAPAARLLAVDAARRAGDGTSKEDWILEVLKGHASDEDAQLRCLRLIVALWSEGPWPWPAGA